MLVTNSERPFVVNLEDIWYAEFGSPVTELQIAKRPNLLPLPSPERENRCEAQVRQEARAPLQGVAVGTPPVDPSKRPKRLDGRTKCILQTIRRNGPT